MEKVVNNQFNWRYERKFIVENISEYHVESIIKLHPAFFKEIFYKRQINNIYLDNYEYKNYFENIDGASNRIKARIRWYGKTFTLIENPVLEFKIKNGYLGRKKNYKLKAFELNNIFSRDILMKIFEQSDIPDNIKEGLKAYFPTLLNVYKRKYFMSYDKKFRITIDSEMKFYRIKNYNNEFTHKFSDDYNIVLEIKYNKDEDDFIKYISNKFPFRLTKNSKYIQGRIYIF